MLRTRLWRSRVPRSTPGSLSRSLHPPSDTGSPPQARLIHTSSPCYSRISRFDIESDKDDRRMMLKMRKAVMNAVENVATEEDIARKAAETANVPVVIDPDFRDSPEPRKRPRKFEMEQVKMEPTLRRELGLPEKVDMNLRVVGGEENTFLRLNHMVEEVEKFPEKEEEDIKYAFAKLLHARDMHQIKSFHDLELPDDQRAVLDEYSAQVDVRDFDGSFEFNGQRVTLDDVDQDDLINDREDRNASEDLNDSEDIHSDKDLFDPDIPPPVEADDIELDVTPTVKSVQDGADYLRSAKALFQDVDIDTVDETDLSNALDGVDQTHPIQRAAAQLQERYDYMLSEENQYGANPALRAALTRRSITRRDESTRNPAALPLMLNAAGDVLNNVDVPAEETYAASLVHGRALLEPYKHKKTSGIKSFTVLLRTYEPRLLALMELFIKQLSASLAVPISGPNPLPTKTRLWTVPRSPFIYKKSQQNFTRSTHSRVFAGYDTHPDVVSIFFMFLRKHQLGGVGMRFVRYDRAPVGVGRHLDKMKRDTEDFYALSGDVEGELMSVSGLFGEDAAVGRPIVDMHVPSMERYDMRKDMHGWFKGGESEVVKSKKKTSLPSLKSRALKAAA